MYFSLELGVTHDLIIWRRHHPPLSENDHVLGDAAYTCRGEPFLITPFKRSRGRELSPRRQAFNRCLQWFALMILNNNRLNHVFVLS
jgi:hypothetical protein